MMAPSREKCGPGGCSCTITLYMARTGLLASTASAPGLTTKRLLALCFALVAMQDSNITLGRTTWSTTAKIRSGISAGCVRWNGSLLNPPLISLAEIGERDYLTRTHKIARPAMETASIMLQSGSIEMQPKESPGGLHNRG